MACAFADNGDYSLQKKYPEVAEQLAAQSLDESSLPLGTEGMVFGRWISPDGGFWHLGEDHVMSRDENRGAFLSVLLRKMSILKGHESLWVEIPLSKVLTTSLPNF